MANVDDIVRGLTKAQREALVAAYDDTIGRHAVLFLRNRSSTRIIASLRKKGISEEHRINIDRLTAAGLEVRARLLSSSGEG